MRDKRKYCRPIVERNPKVGDIVVKLKCGELLPMNQNNYNKVKNFFEIDSFVGEDDPTDVGNIVVVNKETGIQAAFSTSDYNSIKDDFEILEVTGSKKNPFNEHEYVDLGLPSGTLWSIMNVGATSEIGVGTYFKYGETTPYDGTSYETSEYTDEVTGTLPLENDAANVNWGGDWHIPTKAQWNELVENTTHTYIADYDSTGVNVFKFAKTSDSSVFIIIPVTGSYSNGVLNNSNTAYYWASTQRNGSAQYALFDSSVGAPSFNPDWPTAYGHGNAVRAVCDNTNLQGLATTGDIICHNTALNTDAVFSYQNWLELDDNWDAIDIYGIETIEEEDAVGGEYIIMANGTTFIINASDYSQISSQWEHVDTIP